MTTRPLPHRAATQHARQGRRRSCFLRRMMATLTLALFGTAFTAEAATPGTRVRLETTMGDIDIALYDYAAPRTVENFLELVDSGFYDGLIFHRVVAGFVIQAGGYEPDLSYREPPRTVVNESANGLRNRRGTLAMARLADPDSADSQFFINVDDNTHLDMAPGQPGYAVFGEVTGGMDVVTEIELVDAGRQGEFVGLPETPVLIERAFRLE